MPKVVVPEKITEAKAKELAWRKGYLRWKLDDNQKGLYDQIKASKAPTFYMNLSRRVGKSFLLCILAIEQALAKPDAQIKYAAATGKAVKRIVKPIMKKIIQDCPDDIKPFFSALDGEFRFKNGSTIAIAGCDSENYENLRGTDSDLNIVDEAGFIDNLRYIIDDVLAPMTLETGGHTVIASTPAVSPGHDSVEIARICKARGDIAYAHRTIWDNPRMSDKRKRGYLIEKATEKGMSLEDFMKTSTYRREYMAEFVVDQERAVIPEWTDTKAAVCVRTEEDPPYYDRYVGLDIGFRDGSGALFGYWDYRTARLVIQDEVLLFKANTETLAKAIRSKEEKLWGALRPYLRISDNDLNIIADLQQLHGLTFIATQKDDKERQVNELRILVRNDKVIIRPNCTNLITQLASTVWNESRTTYERNTNGHGDLLDALVYLVRNLRRSHNPYPDEREPDEENYFVSNSKGNISAAGSKVLSMFGKVFNN